MTADSLAGALAELQSALPSITKGKRADAGQYGYTYADLASVSAIVMRELGPRGLSFSAKPTLTDDGFMLVYVLRHTSGDQDSGWWPLPDPAKNTPQQIGSAITYARRYTLCAMTGVAPDDDDDGAAANTTRAEPKKTRKPRAKSQRAPSELQADAEAAGDLKTLQELWNEAVDTQAIDIEYELDTAEGVVSTTLRQRLMQLSSILAPDPGAADVTA